VTLNWSILLYNPRMSRSASEVTVVTVNWNGKEHLESLLPTLGAVKPGEILLVDNGSSDGSQAFVRKNHPEVRILQNEANRGFAHPMNMAAREAKGKYLALVNNDMRVHPQWLAAALGRLTPSTPCVACRILDWEGKRVDYNGSSLQYLGYALQRDIGRLVEEVGADDRVLFPCGGAMLIDRELFLAQGGFDEDYFAIFEDVDLGWRIWLSGHEIAFCPDSIVYHRGHGTFVQHANEKMRYLMHRNALMTVLKNYEEEVFRKVLPLAVILAVKRAVIFSGVEKESFYLWTKSKARLDTPDPAARSQFLDALNHLVVLDDLFESLPKLMEKRGRVQAARRRGDQEILDLFVDPLRTIVEDPAYLELESQYLRWLNLDSFFEAALQERGRKQEPTGTADDLQARVEALRRQLNSLRWTESMALQHPPSFKPGVTRRVLSAYRRNGLREVFRLLRQRLARGM
jgi:GT2 family glycosyltransferase